MSFGSGRSSPDRRMLCSADPIEVMARAFLFSCFVCLLVVAPASAQQPKPPQPQPQPLPSGSEAGRTLFDRLLSRQDLLEFVSANQVRFRGQVEQEWDGQTKFFAEQVDFFIDTSRLVASGNVVFQNTQGHIAADSVEFDLKNNTGTFHVASGLMPIGSANPRQFGNQEADVYFWGDTIEKVGDKKYLITRGGFTTCVQPTPRWELHTGNLVLNLDDYAVATNTVLRVKGVPVVYMPWVYYPIQDDGRATGFLLPTYGTSTLRGQAISNAFFWAISRSQDATFFHDWFTNTGQGVGVEYRYIAAAQSLGNLRLYRIYQHEAGFTDNGQTTTLPATKSFEVSGTMNHTLSRNVRARARLEYFSNVVTQQLYYQDVYKATRNNRIIEGGLTAAFGPTSTNLLYSRSEYLSDANNSTVYGSTPRVSTSVAPQRLLGSPLYTSMNAEYAYLPSRTISNGVVTNDDSHARVDMTPTLRVPLSRLTFLSVNTSANYRATYYSRSAGPTGGTISDPYFRQYIALHTDIVGPVFTRIWDRPDSVFAERLKHVIEPAFSVGLTSRIEDFARTPIVSDVSEFVVGGAAQFTYGLTNRFLARGKTVGAARGQTREFLTVGLQQTAYSNPESARYDSTYQSTFGYPRPVERSPLALTARVSPTVAVDGNLRAEYDTYGFGLQLLSAGGSVNARAASAGANYSWRKVDDSNFVSTYTTLRWWEGRANGTYSLSWDIARAYVVSQSIVGSYLAQCCGLQLEFQRFNYPETSGIPIASDTRFNVGFVLAGLGTFSNFFGAFGGQR
jgi:LPS-assembly protein